MAETFANRAQSTLASGADASQLTITVANGAVFPAGGTFRVLVDTELMICTSRTGNVLTVTRGAESSVAAAHGINAQVTSVLTAGVMVKVPLTDQANTFSALQTFTPGIQIGADTNLYRSSATILATDSQFRAQQDIYSRLNSSAMLMGSVSGTKPGLMFDAAATGDVILYREAANQLKTDDAFAATSVDGTPAGSFTNMANTGTTAGLLSTVLGGTLRYSGLGRLEVTGGAWNDLTNGVIAALSGSLASVPMVARGIAAQTGNLQEWQNSGSTPLAKVAASGAFTVIPTGSPAGDQINVTSGILSGGFSGYSLSHNVGAGPVRSEWISDSNKAYLGTTTAHDLTIRRGSSEYVTLTNGVVTLFQGEERKFVFGQNSGNGKLTFGTGATPQVYVHTGIPLADLAGSVAFQVRANAAQSASIQQWQDVNGVALTAVGSDGRIQMKDAGGTLRTMMSYGTILQLGGQLQAGESMSLFGPGGINFAMDGTTRAYMNPSGRLNFDLADSGVTRGIVFGSAADTNLYRSGADTLKTDDTFNIGGRINFAPSGDVSHVMPANNVISLFAVTGDLNWRHRVWTDGTHEWGDGTLAVDTNLYRSAANQLKTDDSFYAVGTIQTEGGLTDAFKLSGSTWKMDNTGIQTWSGDASLTRDTTARLRIFHPSGGFNAALAFASAGTYLGQTAAGNYITGAVDGDVFLRSDNKSIHLSAGNSGATKNLTVDGATGQLFIGAADTNLYRSAADTLKTDDGLHVAGEIHVLSETSSALRTRFLMGKASGSDATGDLYLNYGIANDVNVGNGVTGTNVKIPNGSLVASGGVQIGEPGTIRLAGGPELVITSGATDRMRLIALAGDSYIQHDDPIRFSDFAGSTQRLGIEPDTYAAGETAILLRRNVGGVFSSVRVSMGAADSGGAGFKVLRVPN